MIQTWRIMTGKDRVDASTWFDFEADRPREGATTTRNAAGHHAIRPREFKYVERWVFFSNWVVKEYNELPNTVNRTSTFSRIALMSTEVHHADQAAGPQHQHYQAVVDQCGLAECHNCYSAHAAIAVLI